MARLSVPGCHATTPARARGAPETHRTHGRRGAEASAALQRAEVGEDGRRVRVHVADLVGLRDHALGIDEIAQPLGEADLLGARVTGLVRDADLLAEVGEQPEREVEFVAKCPVGLRCVERDAEDLAVQLGEFVGLVTQALALDRSTRSVGHRVPPEEHPWAAEIGEPDRVAVLVDDPVELRCSRTGGEHPADCTASGRPGSADRSRERGRRASPARATSRPAPYTRSSRTLSVRIATRAPTADSGIAAIPNASTTDQSMWPSAAWTIVPGTASAAATTSDDAKARLIGRCSTSTNNGARRKPPPLASRPDSSPTVTATTTSRVRHRGRLDRDLVRVPGTAAGGGHPWRRARPR